MSKSPDQKNEQTKIPGKLPVLPVRDLVVFPQMVLPLFVGRDLSVKAIEKAAAEKKLVLLG